MRRKIIIWFLLVFIVIGVFFSFLISSHNKNLKKNIITTVEENNRYIVGINYPKVGIERLDKIIKDYVDNEYNYFIKNYGDSDYLIDRDELNIDCQFYILNNNYISISLTTYINSYKLAQPVNEVKSFFYSIKANKMLSLGEILDIDEQYRLLDYIKKQFNSKHYNAIIDGNLDNIITISSLNRIPFYIDQDNFCLYFNPDMLSSDYYDIIKINVPTEYIKFKFKINYKLISSPTIVYGVDRESIDPKGKVVALTFDDGPSFYTEDILKILKSNDVCATFFILGNKVETYQETLKISLKNGNELGNHSYNHKWLSRLSTTNLLDQINSTQNIIKETLNYTPIYLRPTYGSVTTRIRKNTDLKIALWTVDTKDWKIRNVNRIVEKATTGIEDGDIILMHDIFERSAEALKEIIPILKKQGFQFVTLSELDEIKLLRGEFNGDYF